MCERSTGWYIGRSVPGSKHVGMDYAQRPVLSDTFNLPPALDERVDVAVAAEGRVVVRVVAHPPAGDADELNVGAL